MSRRRSTSTDAAGSDTIPSGGGDAGLLAELRTALAVAGILRREPSLARYHQRVDELIGAVPDPARIVVRRPSRRTGTTVTP